MNNLNEDNDFEEITDDVPTHKGAKGDVQKIVQTKEEQQEVIISRVQRIDYIRKMFFKFSRVIDDQKEFLHNMKGRSHNKAVIEKRIEEIKDLQSKLNEFSFEMTEDNFDSRKIADFIHEIDNDLTAPVFYKGIKKSETRECLFCA